MGRGDTKSARGKIFKGSYGKYRKRCKKKGHKVARPQRVSGSRR